MGERGRHEEIRQEWRVQHDVAWNIADDGFVEEAISGTHDGFAIALHIPGQSNAGSEVVVVPVVDPANIVLQDHSGSFQSVHVGLNILITRIEESREVLGAEVAEQSVRFFQYGVQFIAQTIVQGQIAAQLETVLEEQAVTPVAEVAVGVTHELQ